MYLVLTFGVLASGRYEEMLNSPEIPETTDGVALLGGSIQATLLVGVALFMSRRGVAWLPRSKVALQGPFSRVKVSLAHEGLLGVVSSNFLRSETRDSCNPRELALLRATGWDEVLEGSQWTGVELEFRDDLFFKIELRAELDGVLKFVDITTVSKTKII